LYPSAEIVGERGGRPVYRLSTGHEYYSGQGVGELWEEMGQLQLDFLVREGLQPQHRLLDVGCGSLRGGVRFLEYLRPGNYHGIDANERMLAAAREVELPRYGLEDRDPHLVLRDDFDFSTFGTSFHMAIAQSVFTHLPWNSIQRCLAQIGPVLAPGGRLFATFFEDPDGSHRARPLGHEPGGVTTYPDRDPYHYELAVFEELGERLGLRVRYLGDWGHPRGQRMLEFSVRRRGRGDRPGVRRLADSVRRRRGFGPHSSTTSSHTVGGRDGSNE
jgi:SAM-dependent methyltransferase